MAIYTKEGHLISGNMQDHLQEAYKHRAGNLLIEKRIAAAVAAEREACGSLIMQMATEETRTEVKEALLEAYVAIKQRWLGEVEEG